MLRIIEFTNIKIRIFLIIKKIKIKYIHIKKYVYISINESINQLIKIIQVFIFQSIKITIK